MRVAIDKVRPNATNENRLTAEKTDEDLLRDYKATRNRLAFEALVHRYERELYSYLSRYLSDATLAEDAFQATFLQVHLKLDQFDPERKFRPWLYTIATHQAIDAQRRNKRHRLVSLDKRNQADFEGDLGTLLQTLQSTEPAAASNMEREAPRPGFAKPSTTFRSSSRVHWSWSTTRASSTARLPMCSVYPWAPSRAACTRPS